MKWDTPLIIANWKMNLGLQDSIALAQDVVSYVEDKDVRGNIVLCPVYTALLGVYSLAQRVRLVVHTGAQDVSYADKGAYTGEVSPWMAKEVGADFAIIGHSERRIHLGETDFLIHQKLNNALHEGLIPIVCVGETFDQKKEGDADQVILRQLQKALTDISFTEKHRLVIAYEPVWAMSPSRAVEPAEASYMCGMIRQYLIDLFPLDIVENISIVYGGSVDATNVRDFIEQKFVHGCLIGSAATKKESFFALLDAVYRK